MKIMPTSGPPSKDGEIRVATRPKALFATAFSIIGALGCVAAILCDCSLGLRLVALTSEAVMVTACALFWRFERPREVRLKGGFPEPPVIRGI
jgi:hypothetical protein